MKNDKDKKNWTKNTSSTGNIDEGLNETTRIPYTDSVSTPSTKQNTKGKKK